MSRSLRYSMAICGRATGGVLRSGEPVVFDPAVYYGDREADLAMTRLFGGLSAGVLPRLPGTNGHCPRATNVAQNSTTCITCSIT